MTDPLLELVRTTVGAAAVGERRRAAAGLADIFERGPGAVSLACLAWGRLANELVCGGRACSSVQLALYRGDEQVEPEEVGPEQRPMLWAARFLVALGNRDEAMAEALLLAAMPCGQEMVRNAAELVRLAGDALRQFHDENCPAGRGYGRGGASWLN